MTDQLPPHRDPRVVDAALAALDAFAAEHADVRVAVVLTDDGFEVARAPRDDEADGRVASMASSLQALGEAVAHALSLGAADHVAVTGEAGSFLVRRVPGLPLALVVVSGDEYPDAAAEGTRALAAGLADALASATP